MTNLRTMIFDAEDMLIMRLGETPRDNLRSAYEIALKVDNKQPHMVEAAADMFDRTGKFIFTYIATLNQIAVDFYERTGLTGGATGSASIKDIQFLTTPDAKELFLICFAQVEAATFKKDLIAEMISWAAKKKEMDGLGAESKDTTSL